MNKFREIGDFALQYNPAHALIAGAAVRFLLQVSINDIYNLNTTADDLKSIFGCITRGTLYEYLYFSISLSVRSELKPTLLRLHTAILTYLARARRYCHKGHDPEIGRQFNRYIGNSGNLFVRNPRWASRFKRCTHLIDSEPRQDITLKVSKNQTTIVASSADLKALTTHIHRWSSSYYAKVARCRIFMSIYNKKHDRRSLHGFSWLGTDNLIVLSPQPLCLDLAFGYNRSKSTLA